MDQETSQNGGAVAEGFASLGVKRSSIVLAFVGNLGFIALTAMATIMFLAATPSPSTIQATLITFFSWGIPAIGALFGLVALVMSGMDIPQEFLSTLSLFIKISRGIFFTYLMLTIAFFGYAIISNVFVDSLF